MNHLRPQRTALFAAAVTLAALLTACSGAVQSGASTRAAPSAQTLGVSLGETQVSQYPAPQGEVEELPAQF